MLTVKYKAINNSKNKYIQFKIFYIKVTFNVIQSQIVSQLLVFSTERYS